MRIAFLDGSHLGYDAEAPFKRPLGGTQSALCYLAVALARRGHDVTMFNATQTQKTVLGVHSRGLLPKSAVHDYDAFDVIIVPTSSVGRRVREVGVKARLVSWQHQSSTSSNVSAFGTNEEREAWAQFVFVSDDQRQGFVRAFQVDGVVQVNAPAPPFSRIESRSPYSFESGSAPTFAYSSAPGRGLDFLLVSFASIRAAVPGATLRIFSDQKLYQIEPENDDYAVYYTLAKALPGVEYVGSVPQTDLAEALRDTDYWLYPTTFVETSCIALMEAGAAGCGLIVAKLGALPETAAGFATLVRPESAKATWAKVFADAVIERVRRDVADPAAARDRLDAQARHFRAMTWDLRAAEWESMLVQLRPGVD